MGRMVTLTAADGHRLDAYLAEPQGEPRGGLLVIQEVFGVNEHLRAVCDDYAGEGYRVLAPALYDRQERGAVFGYAPEEMNRVRALRRGIDWDKLPLDVAAGIAALRPMRIGMVGYCLGGSVTWLAACRLGIEAGSCYYPTDIAKQFQETPRCPVIVHFAEHDHIVLPDIVEKVKAAHPGMPIHLYPAEHGFNCWHRPMPNYHPESALLARERTLALFEKYVAR
jgi:carboxymethylenebutenolidase